MILLVFAEAFGQSLRQMYCSASSACAEPLVARPLSVAGQRRGQRGLGLRGVLHDLREHLRLRRAATERFLLLGRADERHVAIEANEIEVAERAEELRLAEDLRLLRLVHRDLGDAREHQVGARDHLVQSRPGTTGRIRAGDVRVRRRPRELRERDDVRVLLLGPDARLVRRGVERPLEVGAPQRAGRERAVGGGDSRFGIRRVLEERLGADAVPGLFRQQVVARRRRRRDQQERESQKSASRHVRMVRHW